MDESFITFNVTEAKICNKYSFPMNYFLIKFKKGGG
jgi:hypothetical protein